MKKTISLLISIALIFTLILPVYAADVQIKPTNVIMDMTSVQLVDDIMGAASTDRLLSLDGVVNHAVQFRHRSVTNALESYAGYNNVVEYGRTKDKTVLFEKSYAMSSVTPNDKITPFVRYGYLWYFLLFAVIIFTNIIYIIHRRKRK